MMKTIRRLAYCLAAAFVLLYTGCDQEPLFWDISQEYPPIEPIIEGAPSRIVACDLTADTGSELYVSNGDVWEYTPGDWHKMNPQPDSQIKTVASITVSTGGTTERLFALDWNGGVWQWNSSAWTKTVSLPNAEQLFGAGDNLFAGVRTGTAGTSTGYSIVKLDNNGASPVTIKSGTGLLMGAAELSGAIYLGTLMGGGVCDGSGNAISAFNGYSITGLLSYNTDLYAATDGGTVLVGSAASATITSSFRFTGAIAGWEHNTDKLLLLGLPRSRSSSGYGYRELRLPGGGITTPGSSAPSSVEIGSQYISAIGEHAVTSIYVLNGSSSGDNEGRPIIFACTAKNGLWSYRARGGRPQWNGEDNGS
jgi:hypothetical protein